MLSVIVRPDHVVTLTYQSKDAEGVVVDDGRQPLTYVHGGYDDIFPKLEQQLAGKAVGDSVTIALAARDAFGDYDQDLVRLESLEQFGRLPKIGALYERDGHIFKAIEIKDGQVVLDANHPLAGMDIVFSATITDIRPASAEDLADKMKAAAKPGRRIWVLGAALAAVGLAAGFSLIR